MNAMSSYWALVHEEAGSFGVSFPDIPGVIAAEGTIEDALAGASEALSAHLAWMKADGDRLPDARSHTALLTDPEVAEIADGATWHRVASRVVQAPRVRVNIMIDPGVLREADLAAEAEGMTRSGLIECALRRYRGDSPYSVERDSRARPERSAAVRDIAAGAAIVQRATAQPQTKRRRASQV